MLPSCPAASAKFPSAQSELGSQWNTQTLSQPNPTQVSEQMKHPVLVYVILKRYPLPTQEVASPVNALPTRRVCRLASTRTTGGRY